MDGNVCFHCGKELALADTLPSMAGACEPCFNAALLFRDPRLSNFLEALEGSAVLVGRDLGVLFANNQFCALVRKDIDQVEGHRIGDVLSCMYARTTGGCGDSDPCFMCDLRRFVGLSVVGSVTLPGASLVLRGRPEGRRITINVTRFNGVALLSIDRTTRTSHWATGRDQPQSRTWLT